MNSILKPLFPALSLVSCLALLAPAVQAESLTASQVQQINSGLFRSSSQDFFEKGRRQLDRETEIILQRRLNSQKTLLKVNKQLRVQRLHQPGGNLDGSGRPQPTDVRSQHNGE